MPAGGTEQLPAHRNIEGLSRRVRYVYQIVKSKDCQETRFIDYSKASSCEQGIYEQAGARLCKSSCLASTCEEK
jgi:hypothetical protein